MKLAFRKPRVMLGAFGLVVMRTVHLQLPQSERRPFNKDSAAQKFSFVLKSEVTYYCTHPIG